MKVFVLLLITKSGLNTTSFENRNNRPVIIQTIGRYLVIDKCKSDEARWEKRLRNHGKRNYALICTEANELR